eukprot:g30502.t1
MRVFMRSLIFANHGLYPKLRSIPNTTRLLRTGSKGTNLGARRLPSVTSGFWSDPTRTTSISVFRTKAGANLTYAARPIQAFMSLSSPLLGQENSLLPHSNRSTRALLAVAGSLLLGTSSWLSRSLFFSSSSSSSSSRPDVFMSSDQAAGASSSSDSFQPKEGIQQVLVKPGAAGPLQLLALPFSPQALFWYQPGSVPAELADCEQREAWVYGARLHNYREKLAHPGDGEVKTVAVPSGNAQHIVKGRLLSCQNTHKFNEKLQAADRLAGLANAAPAHSTASALPRPPAQPDMRADKKAHPPMLFGDKTTFAWVTLRERLPATLQKTIESNKGILSDKALKGLVALKKEILDDAPVAAPEYSQLGGAEWKQHWKEFFQGKKWSQVEWYTGEAYMYRLVLDRIGFFAPGIAIDPFQPQKKQELQSEATHKTLSTALRTSAAAMESSKGDKLATGLAGLFQHALWGNRVDLCHTGAVAIAKGQDKDKADQAAATAENEYLLVDDTARVLSWMKSSFPNALQVEAEHSGLHVGYVLDNSGTELLTDLVLVDFLLHHHVADTLMLHVKSHPTFVSDATDADVQNHINYLLTHGSSDAAFPGLGKRLNGYVNAARLVIRHDEFWTSPNFFYAEYFPPALKVEMQRADLVILKGDANYRRVVGDHIWPAHTPFATPARRFPLRQHNAALLCLRTLKSDPVVGLAEQLAKHLDQGPKSLGEVVEGPGAPAWRVDGRRGMIQAHINHPIQPKSAHPELKRAVLKVVLADGSSPQAYWYFERQVPSDRWIPSALQDAVLSYWFEGVDLQAAQPVPKEVKERWFAGQANVDAAIRARFGTAVEEVAAGRHDSLMQSPFGLLTLVILLDQFSRVVYRNTPQMFAYDAKALELAQLALRREDDLGMEPIKAVWFYLPFEHSEDMSHQSISVAKTEALVQRLPGGQYRDVMSGFAKFATEHQSVIRLFGRFPHRNAILGRKSSSVEVIYLQDGGHNFGVSQGVGEQSIPPPKKQKLR